MTKANTGNWEFTIKHFTLYRMNTYLRSSLGNYERAVALYRWNSELSFGFWHQLVSKRQLFLWPELASGFVNAPSRRQSYISNLTLEIRDLRNRIGHHHRLGVDAVESGFQIINQLAGSIDKELVEWIGSNSRINQLVENHPMKSHLLP